MKKLLLINASGRVSRSLTRRLTRHFTTAWSAHHPGAEIIVRDVGQQPPAFVNETWIAAAFAKPAGLTATMRSALEQSETLIEEIACADLIVIGSPIYNFGMPAQLKAYFDQVIRVGRTFAFTEDSANPYQPLLASKPVIVVCAAGDGALHPGGSMDHLNSFEPHLKTMLGFIGLSDPLFVRIGYEEFQDDRFKQSLERAEAELAALAVRDATPLASQAPAPQTSLADVSAACPA